MLLELAREFGSRHWTLGGNLNVEYEVIELEGVSIASGVFVLDDNLVGCVSGDLKLPRKLVSMRQEQGNNANLGPYNHGPDDDTHRALVGACRRCGVGKSVPWSAVICIRCRKRSTSECACCAGRPPRTGQTRNRCRHPTEAIHGAHQGSVGGRAQHRWEHRRQRDRLHSRAGNVYVSTRGRMVKGEERILLFK
jgi:hypothetical protein